MNLLFEVADVVFLAGTVFVCYVVNKRKAGLWWRVGLFSLLVGGGAGFLLSKLFPVFDADFFPLAFMFIAAVAARQYLLKQQPF